MIDIENAVFTLVAEAVELAFPGIQCVSEIVDAPARFPTLSIREADNAVYRKTLDGDQTEHHALQVFEVDAFSNEEAGGKAQCKAVIQAADLLLVKLGFTRTAYGFTRNADNRISRATARYQGVVGEDFRVYRR